MAKVRKAIIPAAGYGTRFLPATKAIAKEMFPIVDTPAIQYIVEEAINSGIEEILIVVSANKNSIIDHFDRNYELESILKEKGKLEELKKITDLPNRVNIHYIRQKEQLGLGHAVLCGKAFVGNEPFAVMLGDDVYTGNNKPALAQLIDAYNEVECSILGTIVVPESDVSKYGICNPDKGYQPEGDLIKLWGVIEKPSIGNAPSRLAIGGRYVLTPEIFRFLERQTKGVGNEIQLTDSIKKLMLKQAVYAKAIDGARYDIGSRIGFIEAILDFAMAREDLNPQVRELINKKYKEIGGKN